MRKLTILAFCLFLVLGAPAASPAADNADLGQIRDEIRQLKESYENRIKMLEERLQRAEAAATEAKATAARATEKAGAAPVSRDNTFNPAISMILSGVYSNLSKDPADYRITGFIPGGEIGPGNRGFSLAESELNFSASIDPYFRGILTLAVEPDDSVAVEEAYIQTIGLSRGFTVKAGRFFSGIGYLNEHHAHTWDFVDAPLAYQAFLGGQFGDDGVQVKWLAPTDTFLELGGELGRGRGFPGSDRDKNGAGAGALFAHAGGDVGQNVSWRAGLSWLHTSPHNREYTDTDLAGVDVANSFSGQSNIWLADFVLKWAPGGNPADTSFKLQGEYFRRREHGDLTYDTEAASAGTLTDSYTSRQSGWYVQGVYQFMPRWRVGARTERLDGGSLHLASNSANLADTAYEPHKNSLMLEYSPSEFSRIRLQFSRDESRRGATDNQFFIQYLMTLGAHGAHIF